MTNSSDFKFRGVWIAPDGKLIETNDIQSHHSVLNRMDIKNLVVELASKNGIPTSDMTIAALKVGFIRMLNYGNQMALELIARPSRIQNDNIIEKICDYKIDLYRQFSVILNEFVVENSETMEIKTFHSVSELSDYLNSISLKQES